MSVIHIGETGPVRLEAQEPAEPGRLLAHRSLQQLALAVAGLLVLRFTFLGVAQDAQSRARVGHGGAGYARTGRTGPSSLARCW